MVFATGGFGKIFKTTSNAHTLTGDGMGIVYRKGLPLEDMEFFQFHPTGLAGPGHPAHRGRPRRGRHPAQRATASGSWSATRRPSRTSRRATWWPGRWCRRCARAAAPARTGTTSTRPHPPRPELLEAKLPDITEFSRTYLGIDPITEPVPVFPTAHYAMGGIPTNVDAEVLANNTDVVPGLYAAGECACVSVHGANRLGTNSLLDINVFGRRAGIAAAEYAHATTNSHAAGGAGGRVDRRWCERPADTTGGSGSPTSARPAGHDGHQRRRLPHRGDPEAGARRHPAAQGALRHVAIQDKGKRYNTDLLEAIELGFLLDLAEVLVVGALARNESRGGHAREDYPTRDDVNFMRHTMAYKQGPELAADIRLDYKPVVRPATSRWSASTDDRRPCDTERRGDPAAHRLPPVPEGAVMLTVHIRRFNPELDEPPHWRPTASRRCPPTGCSTRCTTSSGT